MIDLDSPVGADHEHRPLARAIDHQPEIALPLDLKPLLHPYPPDPLPGGSRLIRDECHAEHLAGGFRRGLRAFDDFDAAALPSSASVDLCLDDHRAPAKPLGDRARRVRIERDVALGNWYAVPGQDRLGLILVNLHRVSTVLGTERPSAPAQSHHHVPGLRGESRPGRQR